MTGFNSPEQMDPRYLHTHYVLSLVMCAMYAGLIGLIALLYAAVPNPVWAMPLGIAVVFGARASRWAFAYRKLIRSRSIAP